MEYSILRDKAIGNFVYVEANCTVKSHQEIFATCKTPEEAENLCFKLNSTGNVTVADFYTKTRVDWRTEFERYVEEGYAFAPFSISSSTYEDWIENYKNFAIKRAYVKWCPFEPDEALTDYSKTFNFAVYEFASDGFYNCFEVGEKFTKEDYYFVRVFRNRLNAMEFVKDHNAKKREQSSLEQELNKYVEKLIPEKTSILGATMDWKEAMKALIDGKRVEARVCIPGLPESENGWFEIEFAIGPDDKEFGESVKFGKDWDYRILDDSKERVELFDECEKLGIINISKVSKVSTPLLRDIVDAIKSIDLDWEGIAKQINEERQND